MEVKNTIDDNFVKNLLVTKLHNLSNISHLSLERGAWVLSIAQALFYNQKNYLTEI